MVLVGEKECWLKFSDQSNSWGESQVTLENKNVQKNILTSHIYGLFGTVSPSHLFMLRRSTEAYRTGNVGL